MPFDMTSPCPVMEFICYVDWFPWLCSSSVYLVPCENVVFFTALSVRFFGFCFSNMHCIVVSPPSPRPCEGKYLLFTSTYQLYHYLKEPVQQGLWSWRVGCMLEKLNFVIPLAFRSSWSTTGPWTLPPDVQLWGHGHCRLHPCLGPAPPWRVVVSGSSLRAVISQLLTCQQATVPHSVCLQ